MRIGDLLYLTADRNRTCARHPYLVASVNGIWCNLRKFVALPYHVKSSDCFKVPAFRSDAYPIGHDSIASDSDSEEEPTSASSQAPALPYIPQT